MSSQLSLKRTIIGQNIAWLERGGFQAGEDVILSAPKRTLPGGSVQMDVVWQGENKILL
jgi:hypothetical protein